MTATTAVPPEVGAYLAAVREHLADLPAAERDDLLAEVEASLVEAAAEGGAISARLGPPDAFATELRTAAGLQDARPTAPTETSLAARLVDALVEAWSAPATRRARARLRELAPIWWIGRAYVAVAAVALAAGASWTREVPPIPHLGAPEAGVLALAAASAASIAIGFYARGRRALGLALVGANIALLLATPTILARAAEAASRPEPFAAPPAATPTELTYAGVRVSNIYPYSRDGRLLHDVLLYDGAGRPIEIGVGTVDPNRRVLRSASNKPIYNAFPIRYYEPGTRRVARPNAAPPVNTPEVRTAPLPRR